MPIAFSRFAEVLDSFLSFEIGKKSLVSKQQSRMEAEAAVPSDEPLLLDLKGLTVYVYRSKKDA